MSFKKFDYGWQVTLGASLMGSNALLQIIQAVKERKIHFWKLMVFDIGLGLAAPLEIFEFRPLFDFFDGHALWHAAGIPLAFFWVLFLIDDTLYHVRRRSILD
mmetsp:Transcript_6203/g.15715  ORF Transcript_6203/g.15715 Transcript_6203/m.15715 type:complete len:103 (-) Transcript_6203:146-454(-)